MYRESILLLFTFTLQLELSKFEEKIGRLEEDKKSGEHQQRKLQETLQQMDNLKVWLMCSGLASKSCFLVRTGG